MSKNLTPNGSHLTKVFLNCVLLVSLLQPFMSPRYPGGPRPSLRMPNQPPGSIPGSQPLLPNSLDPTRPQGTGGMSLTPWFPCLFYWRFKLRLRQITSCSLDRTSEHGRSDEDEPPSRDGRHGPPGRCRLLSLLLQWELWASGVWNGS